MDKTLLITLCSALILLLTSITPTSDQPTRQLFQSWKQQHKISHSNEIEELYRYKIFKQNWQRIQDHNALNLPYTLGLNQFSAMSEKEWRAAFLGDMGIVGDFDGREVEVGVQVDWVQKGAVLPVKNSGSMCAASYATSAVGALESLRKIKDGLLKKLSEQEIIDCSTPYGNHGCSSGLPVNTYKYAVAHGISDDSQYPYTGTAKACQTQYSTFKISAYAEAKTCEDLSLELQKQPVSVLVDASNWSFYRSGIFTQCAGTTLNLAVLLVGMAEGYWRVRNQWGTAWGEQGYIRLAMGNCCGICSMASAPIK